MIFGIISLVICTIMTFEKELVDNNNSMPLNILSVEKRGYFLVSTLSVLTTTMSYPLKTTVCKKN